jgi:hypothetical protein
MRVFEIHTTARDRCLGHSYVGLRLAFSGDGRFILLGTHRIDTHELACARRREIRSLQTGTRFEQCSLGTLILRAVDCIVDLIEGLPCLDPPSFCEQLLFDDASNLRPNFRH